MFVLLNFENCKNNNNIYNNSSSCYIMLTILMRSMEKNEANFVGKCQNREFGKLEGSQAIKNQH
jgi:hypothetical protein